MKNLKKHLITTLSLAMLSMAGMVAADNTAAAESTPLQITATSQESCFETAYINGQFTITGYRFPGGSTANEIIVPAAINGQKVRAIGAQVFNTNGVDLHRLYLPDTLETIQKDAFSNCKILRVGSYSYTATGDFATVETATAESAFTETPVVETDSIVGTLDLLPSSLTSIEDYAFYKSDVTNLIFNSQNLTIGSYAFAESSAGRDITLNAGAGIATIGEYAFQNNTNLHNATINGTIGTIKKGAFQGCNNFNQFIIGLSGSVTTIESEAFMNCGNLHTVTLRGTLSSVGSNAFSNCTNMNDLVVESTTPYTIGEYAFQNNQNLHNVTLSDGIHTIEKGTFENCTNMNTVRLPESVTKIEEDAFKEVDHLKEITISKDTVIEANAFSGAGTSTLQALANSGNASAQAIAGMAPASTPAPTPVIVPVVQQVVAPPAPEQPAKVAAVKLKKAKKKGKKVTLTWSKNKKASGYTIYKKVVKKGTKAKKAKKIKFKKVKNVGKNKAKITLKLAKKSTTYFYVKAYVKSTVNGKKVTTYSKASNTKKVKMK